MTDHQPDTTADGDDAPPSQPTTESPTPGRTMLDGTAWRAADVAGSPVPAGTDVTIEFSDGNAFGRGGVNSFRGSYSVEGDHLTFGPLASTMMAGPPELMELERRWFQSLGPGSKVEITGLRLVHADGSTSTLVPRGPFVTVSGAVTYLARIAMLPGSTVVVQLVDTAIADAPSPVIAQSIVNDAGNVPVPFELSVDRSAVPAHARLGLRATIEHEGQLRWTTDEFHAVDLDDPSTHELILRPVAHDDTT